MNMRYLSANKHYREKFGKRMYKASVSISSSCPNRDGTVGHGGCAFCSGEGSGEFASSVCIPVSEQIDLAIDKVSSKTDDNTGFIAYFQSFTSTYIQPDILRKALQDAINHPRVEAIAIATRPDCLGEDIMNVLREVSKEISLSIELGMQTSCDETADSFGRGFTTAIYDDAVKRLKDIGAEVVTHIIFGLPGEDESTMMESVKHAVSVGTDAIKFTCLFILAGTRYEKLWRDGGIKVLEMDEYFDLVEQALEYIPEGMPILRVTGDGPKKILLAPMWTANKRAVVNYINRRFGQ